MQLQEFMSSQMLSMYSHGDLHHSDPRTAIALKALSSTSVLHRSNMRTHLDQHVDGWEGRVPASCKPPPTALNLSSQSRIESRFHMHLPASLCRFYCISSRAAAPYRSLHLSCSCFSSPHRLFPAPTTGTWQPLDISSVLHHLVWCNRPCVWNNRSPRICTCSNKRTRSDVPRIDLPAAWPSGHPLGFYGFMRFGMTVR